MHATYLLDDFDRFVGPLLVERAYVVDRRLNCTQRRVSVRKEKNGIIVTFCRVSVKCLSLSIYIYMVDVEPFESVDDLIETLERDVGAVESERSQRAVDLQRLGQEVEAEVADLVAADVQVRELVEHAELADEVVEIRLELAVGQPQLLQLALRVGGRRGPFGQRLDYLEHMSVVMVT